MSDLSFNGLQDEEGRVYVIGVPNTHRSVQEWLYSDEFREQWENVFDHADFIPIPADATPLGEVVEMSREELEEVLNDE